MGLATEGDNIGVYKACIRDANSLKDLALPSLFGEGNELNPGPVPRLANKQTAVCLFPSFVCLYQTTNQSGGLEIGNQSIQKEAHLFG